MLKTPPLLMTMSLAVMLGSGVAPAELRTQPAEPETFHITIDELPEPFATESVQQNPKVVDVPEDAVLHAPEGFEVELFAEVEQARWLALTPNGRPLCVSSKTNTIFLLEDRDGDGRVEQHVFLTEDDGLNQPFGVTFAEDAGQTWCYVANTDGVIRFPYKEGADKPGGPFQLITQLPGGGYNQHWTRNVVAAPPGDDGQWLYITVGSVSNVDVEAPPRASLLRMRPDGTGRELVASGLRNPVGLDFHPDSQEVYVTVNERDKIGDGLVPDYLTRVEKGGFYGWPYAYLTPEKLDPRRLKGDTGESERPDLVEQTLTPDVLFESHSAALGLAFYPTNAAARTASFPEKYHGGAFVAFRGSWNRSRGTGYKIVFVPFKDDRPAGGYEDFVWGFLIDPAGPTTWARPVGTLVMPDGSLLFTEDGNGRVYRVRYAEE